MGIGSGLALAVTRQKAGYVLGYVIKRWFLCIDPTLIYFTKKYNAKYVADVSQQSISRTTTLSDYYILQNSFGNPLPLLHPRSLPSLPNHQIRLPRKQRLTLRPLDIQILNLKPLRPPLLCRLLLVMFRILSCHRFIM